MSRGVLQYMKGYSKVKFMESGGAFVAAASMEEAMDKVKSAMADGDGTIFLKEETPVLDFSTTRYFQYISARIEKTSKEGVYAVNFREGNRGRFLPFDLPSKSAVARMNHILELLRS